jgi:disulfide bond formation protein DsbB
VTHDVIVLLSSLAVIGQVLVGAGIVIALLAAFGVRGPLDLVRGVLWGYELWAGFLVASIATGGSLFLSEIARFVLCELCWYQRICMYPLSIVLLLAALADDHRVARYLLPLPIVGAGVSVYTSWSRRASSGRARRASSPRPAAAPRSG